jgi:hypothetical protein
LRYLIQNGYTLVERNYRTRRGEIDLIVSKDDTRAPPDSSRTCGGRERGCPLLSQGPPGIPRR